MEDQGSIPGGSFVTASRLVLGPTPRPIKCVPGAPSLEVRRSGREAEHSASSSAEVKNTWRYTSSSPCPHGVVLN
jgi:hypothetical protein